MDKRAAKVCEMYNKFPFPSIRGNYDSFFRTCVFPALQELGRKGAMKRILDAGCGTGNLTVEIARNFPDAEVVGIDFTDKSLEVASGKINSLGLKNVKLQIMPQADHKFEDYYIQARLVKETARWIKERN